MTLHGQLTAADYTEARRLGLLPAAIRMASPLVSLAILTFGTRIFHPSLAWDSMDPIMLALFALMCATFAFSWFCSYLTTLPPRSEKIFHAIDYLQAPRDLEILPGGLRITSPLVNVSLGWKNAFSSYRIGPNVIVAYQSGGHFQTFPKRWFTPDQLTEFQSHLQAALGPPRSKWL